MLLVMVFFSNVAVSQAYQNHDLWGIIHFELNTTSTRILWTIDVCKNNCFAMDTIAFAKPFPEYSINSSGNLKGDLPVLSPSDIRGKYELSNDTMYLSWGKEDEQRIVLNIIDTLNVKMLYSDIKCPFINKYGHRESAFYLDHTCGDIFSYLNSTKWRYVTEGFNAEKQRISYWYYFDSFSLTPWIYDFKISDTGKVKRYLINE
jgi:hypothetical protein